MKLNFESPYNDNKLVFNETTHKYELTIEVVKENFDMTFADDGVLEKRIRKNSRKIYNYIMANSYSYNQSTIEYLLENTKEGRKFIFDVLFEQMEADLESGYNDLSSTPAINFNGQDKNRDELEKNQVSVDTQHIIDNSAKYFGFNIMAHCGFGFRLGI